MEIVRKIVNADMLTPVIDLPWMSKGLQVEVIVFPIMTKRRENKEHLSTKERIAAFGNTMEDIQLSEIEWGQPQGKEIW